MGTIWDDLRDARAERQKDYEFGKARGEAEFGTGMLGRVGEAPSAAATDLLSQRKNIMEQGLGAAAFQAAREARLRGLGRNEQEQQRALSSQMSRSGIRGGAAAGQLGNLLRQQQSGRAGAEQDLLLQNVAQKQQAMGDYQGLLGQQEAGQLARQQYNIGQSNKEAFGRSASGLAEQQMGLATKSGITQAGISNAMAQAARSSGGKK